MPFTIVSNRGSQITSHFLKSFQSAFGTAFSFSTAFHPRTDVQTGGVYQVLEDMLSACTTDFQGHWVDHINLMEFAYHNSYHSRLGWHHTKAYVKDPVDLQYVGRNLVTLYMSVQS